MSTTRIDVGGEYAVWVGYQALDGLAQQVHAQQRVLVLHQPGRHEVLAQVTSVIARAGGRATTVQLPDAEAAKDASVLIDLWSVLGRSGFTRDDLVVGVGGGAATDVAGFVAATWLRGIGVVQVPTSLLGIVDAAVGGKTGINTPEGKNLVGAFHSPAAVVCDPAWLATMDRADYVSGLGEVIKCGLIADPVILDLVQADPAAAVDPEAPVALDLIARAVRVKADVVRTDLREAALREVLNYGHTFAHAIEQVEDFTWRHGDAVAVGLVYAAELGHSAGRTPHELVERTRALLSSVGLPTAYPGGDWPALRAAMGRDKKARGAMLRFVVLDGLARPGRLEGPDETALLAAGEAVGVLG